MPYDGSGKYVRNTDWTDDRDAGIKIMADRHDSQDDDFASALSSVICKDGQTSVTADIPFNGHKLTNVGDPINPQDAVTKHFLDAVRTFSTGIEISGAGINGRITFTASSGANGLAWTGADLSWLARLAEASKTSHRLVLNDKADGTGLDVTVVDELGNINSRSLSHNVSWDAAAGVWRAIVKGLASMVTLNGGAFKFFGLDAPTAVIDYETAALREFFSLNNNGGSPLITITKSASGKVADIYGRMTTKNRWLLRLGDNTPESGSNVGSDFSLWAYDDSGTSPNVVMTALRYDRSVLFSGAVTSQGILTGNDIISNGDMSAADSISAGNNIAAGAAVSAQTSVSAVGGNMAMAAGGSGCILQFASQWYFDYNNVSGQLIYQTPFGNWFSLYNGGATIAGNLTISGATAVKATAGAWIAPSDIRLKTVNGVYDKGLAELLAVPGPVRFTYKANPNLGEIVGYIAQDIEGVFPEMVALSDGEIDGAPVTDLRQYDPSALTYVLVNAVRELSAKLDEALDRIEALENSA